MFHFSIFACCSLSICNSSLSSYLGFDFLPMVFKGTPIFPQTNFAPAYIKSFNSGMFVGIFVNNSFTFSVSDLTVLQSWFLKEGNVVFFSDMILLMVYTLVFSSWVSVCICVFAEHESLSYSVWLGVSGFPVFIVSVTVVKVCWCVCLYICWWISSISRSENKPFFVIVCCLKSAKFCPDFYHSYFITSFGRVASKITV